MNAWLPWIAPPVVGAVIGYVTNAIAIKMLFRPLKEVRVFGFRIPFTPGILPRQRSRLADNIGRMVARELITEQIVRDRIKRPDFRDSVRRSVSAYTGDLLAAPLSRLSSGENSGASSELGKLVGSLALKFARSEAFSSVVDKAASAAVKGLGEKKLSSLLGGESAERARQVLEGLFLMLASEKAGRNGVSNIAAMLEKIAVSLSASGKPLSALLPSGASRESAALADAAYPMVVDAVHRFLMQDETRSELEIRGRVFLRDAMLRLSIMQRFFVSAANYDRTLAEKMPEIVDDLVASLEEALRDEKTRSRFAEAVGETIGRFLELDLEAAALAFRTDPAALARQLGGKLAAALSDGPSRSAIALSLANSLADFIRPYSEKPLSELLERGLGISMESASSALAAAVRNFIADGGPSALGALANGFIKERGESSLADLLSLDESEKEALDSALADRLLAIMDEKVSAALATLDVRGLVSERIDSLEMEKVERIVLDVMSDQFQWINIFGAILGAIIGLAQAALTSALR